MDIFQVSFCVLMGPRPISRHLDQFFVTGPTREIPSGQNGPIRPFSPSSQSEHGRIDFILAAHGFSHIINVFFKQLCLGYGTEIKVYSSRASE